jgi:molybdopterin converting factor small subunit
VTSSKKSEHEEPSKALKKNTNRTKLKSTCYLIHPSLSISPHMKIQVKLLGPFAKYRKLLKEGTFTIKDESCLKDLIDELKLPAKYIRLIFVNGKIAPRDVVLSDGDTIVFFPPVSGG